MLLFPGFVDRKDSTSLLNVHTHVFSLQTLAGLVTQKNLDEGRVYPPLSQIREVSVKIATALAEYAYNKGTASTYPEPDNKEEFIRDYLYSTEYESFIPETWEWPPQLIQ